MSIGIKLFRGIKPQTHNYFSQRFISVGSVTLKEPTSKDNPKVSFKKDILQKTPIGKLDEFEGKHPYEEKEPLPPFKDGVNPDTGEVGGPRGPEPTRYGDWERKGRVSDF